MSTADITDCSTTCWPSISPEYATKPHLRARRMRRGKEVLPLGEGGCTQAQPQSDESHSCRPSFFNELGTAEGACKTSFPEHWSRALWAATWRRPVEMMRWWDAALGSGELESRAGSKLELSFPISFSFPGFRGTGVCGARCFSPSRVLRQRCEYDSPTVSTHAAILGCLQGPPRNCNPPTQMASVDSFHVCQKMCLSINSNPFGPQTQD